jgi:beta-glucanase (GH16 family)
MKIQKYLVIVILLHIATVCNAQTPPLEGSWEIIPELTDDFEGDKLDDTKWINKNPLWDGRHPSYFEPNNVSLINGKLLLKSRQINDQDRPPFLEDNKKKEKGEYTHAVAAVTSKIKVKYGYFEIKCKPGNSQFWSSFWFYNATPENWTEIDVFEIVASEKYILRTAHLFRSPTYEGTINDHIRAQQEIFHSSDRLTEYHTYALDWNRDKITWYVDGIEVFSAKNEHWHHELYMFFDTQVSPEWPGIPKPSALPVEFNIEYIRSWKKTPDTN